VLDRFKAALEWVVESIVGARLDYLARYPARVVSQDGSGKLELLPDDPRIPGIPGVPIRVGVPGLKLTVPPGARVLLAFEGNGDPSRPIAELWESGTPLTVTFEAAQNITITSPVALDLGEAPRMGVARQGDPVQAGPWPGVITAGSARVKAGL
jgi:hypothetical protein